MFGGFFNFKAQESQNTDINFNSSPLKFNNAFSNNYYFKPKTRVNIPKITEDNLKCFYDIIVDIDNQIENLKEIRNKIEAIIKENKDKDVKEITKENINKIYDDSLTDNYENKKPAIICENNQPLINPIIVKNKKKPVLQTIKTENKEIKPDEIKDLINNEKEDKEDNEDNEDIENKEDIHNIVDDILNEELEKIENDQELMNNEQPKKDKKIEEQIKENFISELNNNNQDINVDNIIKNITEEKLINILSNSLNVNQ